MHGGNKNKPVRRDGERERERLCAARELDREGGSRERESEWERKMRYGRWEREKKIIQIFLIEKIVGNIGPRSRYAQSTELQSTDVHSATFSVVRTLTSRRVVRSNRQRFADREHTSNVTVSRSQSRYSSNTRYYQYYQYYYYYCYYCYYYYVEITTVGRAFRGFAQRGHDSSRTPCLRDRWSLDS